MNEELAHLKQDRENKERDNRMKYGKRYKDVMDQAKKAKDKLYSTNRTK